MKIMEDKFKAISKETLIKFIESENLDLDLLIAFNEREKAQKAWSAEYGYLEDNKDDITSRREFPTSREELAKYWNLENKRTETQNKYSELKDSKCTKMTKDELVKFLHDNFYNDKWGCVDLTDLDFSRYKCDLDICRMAVNGELNQSYQKAKSILQGNCEADDYIEQHRQVAKKIYQYYCVADEIDQSCQEAKTVDQHNITAEKIDLGVLDFYAITKENNSTILTPKKKKMTMKEIETLLGYEIEDRKSVV